MRFFELRKETLMFLETQVQKSEEFQDHMKSEEFLKNLAFLIDVTHILNELNLKLQGKNMIIFEMISYIDAFKHKINYLKECIEGKDYDFFTCCREIAAELPNINFLDYNSFFDELTVEFERRFTDFDTIRPFSALFYNFIKLS